MLRWLRSWFRRRHVTVAPAAAARAAGAEDAGFAALLDASAIAESADVAVLVAAIRSEVAAGKVAIPPMPTAAARILELVVQVDVDLNALVGAMHWEPAMVREVLATASSAAYRRSTQVHDDLRGAILALGVEQVGTIAAAVGAGAMFERGAKSGVFPGLWRTAHHETMVAAFAASAIAHVRHIARHDRVFLRAVISGAARTVALGALASQVRDGRLSPAPSDEAAAAAIDAVHREVATVAIAAWALPEAITGAADLAARLEAKVVELVSLLVELRRSPGRPEPVARVRELVHQLGLDTRAMKMVMQEIDEADQRVAGVMAGRAA